METVRDDRERAIGAAVRYMQQAELHYGLRAWAFGEERTAVLALRATSLVEYVCAESLARAARERQRAANSAEEAERRRSSGRRVHTVAEAKVFQDEVARHLERAEGFESAAVSAAGANDVAAAEFAVSHMNDADAVLWSDTDHEEWFAALEVLKRLRTWQRKRQRWVYVRGRAEQASQPSEGLLPLTRFDRHDFGGALLARRTESGPAGTIASAVELIARWDLSRDPRAFTESSVAALEAIRGVRRGEHSETGPAAIASMLRSGDDDLFDEMDWEDDGDETLMHIAEMRARVSRCFERFGKPTHSGTWPVQSDRFHLVGHIDFVSADTIWDLKVSSTGPSKVDVLQLLLYWLAASDDLANSLEIAYVGIFNPRMDTAWRVAVADIPAEVLGALESIGLAEQLPVV
jgi:hypothetical protein